MLRETDGTWDNGYTHAWTQVRAVLRLRGIVHRKAPRPAFSHGARKHFDAKAKQSPDDKSTSVYCTTVTAPPAATRAPLRRGGTFH
eukprot:6600189-Prymnesium_polylepis.1